MLFALFSALANVFATTISKLVLTKQKLSVMSFQIWTFFWLALLTAGLLPFLGVGHIQSLWQMPHLFYLVVMIVLAVIWNYFTYACLQKKELAEFQLITVMQPLITILLSMIIFSDERNERVLIATVIAGISLILSHFERWRLESPRLTIPLLLGIILSSVENLYIKELLSVINPATLYFVRTAFVALIFFLAAPAAIRQINRQQLWSTVMIGAFAVATMVLSFYGYQVIGVAKTNIIFLLSPITLTLVSVYLLKERIKKRKIVAFIIIILCILYVFYQ